ncbi:MULTISPECIES: hypothetical protein [unclassified Rathayibacter]|uniref:hypothetical protein n=1 Tax=unclassified Rathayibacter TaxID=2609250 RepID=UPI001FB3C906|nr:MULTISPECIES: hypothetical protein [unclassified Rathayibacter]MCJ1674915.1 hypothetical protein [Rathayibacter sp. VKM Ac-2929]MCJ1686368.1 hypothetical protein [Rathayibacter sp. VKM Ac-2927]
MTQDDRGDDAATPDAETSDYSREDYAIHATRSELPLFADAVADRRNDSDWLSSLSGVLGGTEKDTAAAAAQAALERRARRTDGP